MLGETGPFRSAARQLEGDAMLRRKGIIDDRMERWAAAERGHWRARQGLAASLPRREDREARAAAESRVRRLIDALGAAG